MLRFVWFMAGVVNGGSICPDWLAVWFNQHLVLEAVAAPFPSKKTRPLQAGDLGGENGSHTLSSQMSRLMRSQTVPEGLRVVSFSGK